MIRKDMNRVALLLAAAVLATTAYAGGKTDTKPTTPASGAEASASADAAAIAALRAEISQMQAQIQGQQQGQAQGQQQAAHGGQGGDAKATGGDAQAINEGVEQAVQFSYPRQAPAVAQGSLALAGCGAGGNAGGSNTHGAAFLGLAWVTRECHGWTLAQTYAALGYIKAACEVANSQKAARRAQKRGATLPDCDTLPVQPVAPAPAEPSPAVVVVQTPDLSQYVTREVLDRVTERVLAK
jgi:outer membrane murein-binding lipoprotein Lpp